MGGQIRPKFAFINAITLSLFLLQQSSFLYQHGKKAILLHMLLLLQQTS